MRLPIRKPGKYSQVKPDFHLTQEKFNEMQTQLDKLKAQQPGAIAEVRRLAELGDFSENAAYQMAKGRLRSINNKVEDLANRLNLAVIIKFNDDISYVGLGHKVKIEVNGDQKVYTILGSSETDPAQNVISHNSPLGQALLGKKVGETAVVKTKNGDQEFKILDINNI